MDLTFESEGGMAVIGIDLGGTKTAGLVLDGGGIVERCRIDTDASSQDGVMRGLLVVCSRLREDAASRGVAVEAVGLGIAGFVDYERGVVTEAPNHPLRDAHVRDILMGSSGLPVFVDNDANVAALAEARMGAGKGLRYLVHLTLGTGIGGGIIIDGQVYRGALGAAAELGHMIVCENGPPCNCGAHGCLEAMVSGVAICRRVEEMAAVGQASPMVEEFLADPEAFSAEAVCRHADAGEGVARDLLEQSGWHLGIGIASLVNIFNPDAVTLSGGLLGCLHHMEGAMRRSCEENAIAISRDHVRILTGTLGEDGGMLGAALLAREGLNAGR
ncbi:MAG: ROK family protein [Actinomycetota bacterium]|nr:ROK family protein [Actinomycetota bacterium]MDD5667265.1 ROK family protein [Actinomycetota bacterium]